MRRYFVLLVGLACLFGFTVPAQAQSVVDVSGVGVNYTFGGQITFSAKIQTQSTIQAAYLLFQVEGEQNTRTIPLTITPRWRSQLRVSAPERAAAALFPPLLLVSPAPDRQRNLRQPALFLPVR